jgi:anti-anti-sigma regulatory factor
VLPARRRCLCCAAPILFFNANSVKEFIREKVIASKKRREQMGDHIRFVVIDMSPVTDIDSSAMHFLGG